MGVGTNTLGYSNSIIDKELKKELIKAICHLSIQLMK